MVNEKYIQQLEAFSKTLFGLHFKIYPEDYETITKLLIYFLKHEQMAMQHNINLNKGILLTGPVGCGKTTLMKLMRATLPEEQRFGIKSCREITFDFINHGYEIIQRHSTNAYSYNKQPHKTCFDDLGAESTLKYYGNECNVMGEILLSRYDHFISNHMITHAFSHPLPYILSCFCDEFTPLENEEISEKGREKGKGIIAFNV